MTGGGACPDCPHRVSEHTPDGCVPKDGRGGCDCQHDYGDARRRAKEEGLENIGYVTERYDPERRTWSERSRDGGEKK